MAVLVAWVNVLAAALTLAAIGYYAALYTVVLKPNTVWNTVLGGGAGALPRSSAGRPSRDPSDCPRSPSLW